MYFLKFNWRQNISSGDFLYNELNANQTFGAEHGAI